MKRTIVLICAFLLIATVTQTLDFGVRTVKADTYHSGIIIANETWTAAGNDHIINGDLTVAANAVLTIEKGCIVKFAIPWQLTLNVYGTLLVNGILGQPVIFTSTRPLPQSGDWNQILFQFGSSGILKNCNLGAADTAISIRTSNLTAENITISKVGTGFSISNANPQISNVSISSATTGFSISSNANPQISNANVSIYSMAGSAATVNGGNGSFTNSTLQNIAAAGRDIVLENFANLTLLNTTFSDIFIDTSSHTTINWFLDVYVVDDFGNLIGNANVVVRNSTHHIVHDVFTAPDGFVKYLICTEKTGTGDMSGDPVYTYHTPHNVTVTKSGFSTAYANVTIDGSKRITLQLTDIEKPVSTAFVENYWRNTAPIEVVYQASDNVGLKNITLYYKYSADNITFSPDWLFYEAQNISGLTATGRFDFQPSDEGYYKFATIATDQTNNTEDFPADYDTIAAYFVPANITYLIAPSQTTAGTRALFEVQVHNQTFVPVNLEADLQVRLETNSTTGKFYDIGSTTPTNFRTIGKGHNSTKFEYLDTKSGLWRITASNSTMYATTQILVLPAGIAQIDIQPPSATVKVNQTVDFNATALDTFGNVIVGAIFTWSVYPSTIGTIDANGTFKAAKTPGYGFVNATNLTVTQSAQISVITGDIATIIVSPAYKTISADETCTFSATAYDEFGNEIPHVVFVWACENGTITNGLYTPYSAGNWNIYASANGKTGSATVRVIAGNVTVLICDPAIKSITVNTTAQFRAYAYDKNANLNTTAILRWQVWPSELGVLDKTVASAAEFVTFTAGTKITEGYVNATFYSLVGTVKIELLPDELVKIELTPRTATMKVGETQQFSAIGKDKFDNHLKGLVFNWTVYPPDLGTVSAGVFKAEKEGRGLVNASYGSVTGSAQVLVSSIYGSVSGFVTDSGKKPVKEVNVTAYLNNQHVASAFTNSDGAYWLLNLLPGVYDLCANKTGYLDAWQYHIQVTAGNETAGVNFTLYLPVEAGWLVGKVYDDKNVPLADVKIDAGVKFTHTDSKGEYNLSLSPGRYIVTASKEGYLSAVAEKDITAGVATLCDFILKKIVVPDVGWLVGRVVDQNGEPIEGVMVKAGEKTTYTDVNGRFNLTLKPGDYIVDFTKKGYLKEQRRVGITAGVEKELEDVVLKKEVITAPFMYAIFVGIIVICIVIGAVYCLTKRKKKRAREMVARKVEEFKIAHTPLTAVPVDGGRNVKLNWDTAPSDEGYVLYHSTDNINYQKLATLSRGTSEYIHQAVPAGKHYYKIAIIDVTKVESPPSGAVAVDVQVTEKTPPTGLSAEKTKDARGVKLSWTADKTVKNYLIYHSMDGWQYDKIAILPNETTSYTHQPLAKGKHYYKISAIDDRDVETRKSDYVLVEL